MNRREFIQSGSLAVSALALPSLSFKSKKKFGLQLYSLRDVIKKDIAGTLKQVASFGYSELELYEYKAGKILGASASEYGKIVSDLGMKTISGHFGTDLFPDWERAVNDSKSIGLKYMVIPSLSDTQRGSVSNLMKVCDDINKNGELCEKYGMRIGFHNHAQEFVLLEGKTIYERMLDALDPKLVSMEMDLYWVTFANNDPLKLFEKYPGRFEQWHVKDMDKVDRKLQADLGTGSIDFKPIFAQSKLSGMKHFYIEQENYPVSPMESTKVDAKAILDII